MAWTNRVLKVLEEDKYNGELKAKWEIVRPEDGQGKHFKPGLTKTGYYKKNGELTRGYPQILTKYDIAWIDKHRKEIDEALAADYTVQAEIEETPF